MTSGTTPLYRNLDTTFVNLWSLLRNLTERGFVGRVHVDLKDYSADIFLDGSSTPLIREIDQAAATDTLEAGALHRVVLRARETPGTISVFEGAHEVSPPRQQTATALPATPPAKPLTEPSPDAGATSREMLPPVESPEPAELSPAPLPEEPQTAPPSDAGTTSKEPLPTIEPPRASTSTPSANKQSGEIQTDGEIYPAGSYQDWPAILATTGELIGAVERALNATGRNFISLFETVRLELADDYIFLDPIVKTFHYSSGVASLKNEPAVSVFVSGVSEALRRTVDRVAVGDRARRMRELVALEMLSVARQHAQVLERSGFRAQLDRIAGTRVM